MPIYGIGNNLNVLINKIKRSWRFSILLSKVVRFVESATIIGFADLKVRYSRNRFGYAWALTPVLIYTFGLTMIFSHTLLSNQSISFFYIYFGIASWNLFATFFLEGLNVFNSNRSYILNSNLSLHFYIIRQISRNLINFLLVIAPGFLLYLFSDNFSSRSLFFFPISIALSILIGYTIIWISGYIGTLLPDLSNLVPPIIQVLFITTPVFWDKSILEDRKYLYQLNPFYWIIELTRGPLLGSTPSLLSILVIVAILTLGLILISFCTRRVAHMIPLSA